MRSLSLVMSKCSLSGRGQGHINNFYIVKISPQQVVGIHRWYPQLVRSRFVYDTYRTRSRHGWVHMFITYCPTVTLQIHNFGLFRSCRISSFCTVVWQLVRFQLTRRIARSLGDSWASCSTFCFSAVCFFVYLSFRVVVSAFWAFLSSRYSFGPYFFTVLHLCWQTQYPFIHRIWRTRAELLRRTRCHMEINAHSEAYQTPQLGAQCGPGLLTVMIMICMTACHRGGVGVETSTIHVMYVI